MSRLVATSRWTVFLALMFAWWVGMSPSYALSRPAPSNATLEGLSIELSSEAQAALDAGVELAFNCRYAVRKSWWLLSYAEHSVVHRYTLSRHALSNRYMVKSGEFAAPHIFRTAVEATNFIADQARKQLDLYSSEQTIYSLRISLDKFALPTPMRLKAFIADAWDLDTGWIPWSVN